LANEPEDAEHLAACSWGVGIPGAQYSDKVWNSTSKNLARKLVKKQPTIFNSLILIDY